VEILHRLAHGNQSYIKKSISSLPTPSYLVELHRLKQNVETMRQRAKNLGVSLRPHVKTHKTIEAALLQLYGDEIATVGMHQKNFNTKKLSFVS
jgi:D-serine deaminase-like pyridoxal phosphate-dependent protein